MSDHTQDAGRKSRFQIDKLEERIAPAAHIAVLGDLAASDPPPAEATDGLHTAIGAGTP